LGLLREGEFQRQPGQQPCAKGRILGTQGVERLLQQRNELLVDQAALDLPLAESQRGPGQLLGAPSFLLISAACRQLSLACW
jgi:hypothetical protein